MENTVEQYNGLDFVTPLTRLVKYLVEGGAVALAAYFIPRRCV